ncbi:helix-turn-helix domain-containing protein [Halopenitus salinus]|uniref:Helix-turn-helix domain-containing protein n=1 Tax=Halopenitus salinus TaxID=1198295 RepID=A0ABD5UQJ6_9EURY
MRQAVLSIDHETLTEYGFEVFQDSGLLDIEILSCEGPRGVSRLHVEERLDEQRLDDLETVQWWEYVADQGSEHAYLVEMNVADELDRAGVDADSMTRAEWAEVQSRGFAFEVTGSQAELKAMIADLQAAGQNVTLEQLRDYRIRESPLDALTNRQQEVLDVAYELGYYDVPRTSSTEEIAAELGVDDSTVAEHLQRAEHNLLEFLLG